MANLPAPPYPIKLPPDQADLPFDELPFSRQKKILVILQRDARRTAVIEEMLEELPSDPTDPPPPPPPA